MLRRRTNGAASGQSLTELALILPIVALLLLGIVEFSGVFITRMDLDAAAEQGARIAAIEGTGPTCASSSDPNPLVDRDVINAILGSKGIAQSNMQQIQVYRVNPDGSPDSSAINTYTPPFTQTVGGVTVPYSTTGNFNWPPCQRKTVEPSDSLGISLQYTYQPIVALPGFTAFSLTAAADQHLNPPQNSVPCPSPGIPTGVTVANVSLQEPPPTSSDQITWNVVPGATSYNIYANVNGTGYGSAPIMSVSASNGMTQTVTYNGNTTYAPISYEVSGVNYCGEGQRSLPAADGQCALPPTPSVITATQAVTPSTDLITYTAPWTSVPVSSTYLVTQTSGPVASSVTQTFTVPISPTAPLTQTAALTSTGTDPVTYQMSAVNGCGVVSPASAVVTRPNAASSSASIPATGTVDDASTSATPMTNKWTYSGGWVHCSATSSPTCSGLGVLATNLYSNTVSYDSVGGDTTQVQFSWTGSGTHTITLYGAVQADGGQGQAWVDNNTGASQSFDCYNATPAGQVRLASFTITDTGSGTHTHVLSVKVLHQKQSASSNYNVYIDAANGQ